MQVLLLAWLLIQPSLFEATHNIQRGVPAGFSVTAAELESALRDAREAIVIETPEPWRARVRLFLSGMSESVKVIVYERGVLIVRLGVPMWIRTRLSNESLVLLDDFLDRVSVILVRGA